MEGAYPLSRGTYPFIVGNPNLFFYTIKRGIGQLERGLRIRVQAFVL